MAESNKRVYPFANGSQHADWEERNCVRCKKGWRMSRDELRGEIKRLRKVVEDVKTAFYGPADGRVYKTARVLEEFDAAPRESEKEDDDETLPT